jgi:Domain of unknown function (DUF4878)
MKYLFPLLLFVCLVSTSCKPGKGDEKVSENNIDAARNFIRSALDGKFDEARRYMLGDSLNTNYLDVVERSHKTLDRATRDGYRGASINIMEVTEPVKDSVTIVVYSNSFKNDPDTLKVIKLNGQWVVDLKYLYEHPNDTLQKPVNTVDTLQ